jgi:hypothetical protein
LHDDVAVTQVYTSERKEILTGVLDINKLKLYFTSNSDRKQDYSIGSLTLDSVQDNFKKANQTKTNVLIADAIQESDG